MRPLALPLRPANLLSAGACVVLMLVGACGWPESGAHPATSTHTNKCQRTAFATPSSSPGSALRSAGVVHVNELNIGKAVTVHLHDTVDLRFGCSPHGWLSPTSLNPTVLTRTGSRPMPGGGVEATFTAVDLGRATILVDAPAWHHDGAIYEPAGAAVDIVIVR